MTTPAVSTAVPLREQPDSLRERQENALQVFHRQALNRQVLIVHLIRICKFTGRVQVENTYVRCGKHKVLADDNTGAFQNLYQGP
jgi:hypothetical protein